jgi:hypothetical protein
MIEIDAKSVVIKAKCFIIGANVLQLPEGRAIHHKT